jgi:sec-independent protein translocase protein TatB
MFDIGFSEVLLIFVIALVVLGPEKLPRLASQVGRWVGRARAMARQFKEQLEEEVNLEEVRKAHDAKPAQPAGAADTGPPRIGEAPPQQTEGQQPQSASAGSSTQMPDPVDFRADTFSHAHPTNEYGANPLSPNGAAETPAPQMAQPLAPATPDLKGPSPPVPETPRQASSAPSPPSEEPRPASSAPALSTEAPRSASQAPPLSSQAHQSGSSDASVGAARGQTVTDQAPRTESGEAYAPATNPTRTSASDAPANATNGATAGAAGPTTRSDNHGHS